MESHGSRYRLQYLDHRPDRPQSEDQVAVLKTILTVAAGAKHRIQTQYRNDAKGSRLDCFAKVIIASNAFDSVWLIREEIRTLFRTKPPVAGKHNWGPLKSLNDHLVHIQGMREHNIVTVKGDHIITRGVPRP
jgi:hypothetical protein